MLWILLPLLWVAMIVLLYYHGKNNNKVCLAIAIGLAVVFSIVLIIIVNTLQKGPAVSSEKYIKEVYKNGVLVSRSVVDEKPVTFEEIVGLFLSGAVAFLLAHLTAKVLLLDKKQKLVIAMSISMILTFAGLIFGFITLKEQPLLSKIMFSIGGVSLVASVVIGIIIYRYEHK